MNTNNWDNENTELKRDNPVYDELLKIKSWKDIILEDLERLHDNESDDVRNWELWSFNYEDLINMKIWEEIYFIFSETYPILLKRIEKSLPPAEIDYEIYDYLNSIINPPSTTSVKYLVWNKKGIQVTKKYFYKCILNWIYRRKIWELDDRNVFINHDFLRLIEKFVEKKRSLYLPSYIKKNEIDGYTLDELENMDYEGVDETRVMECSYNDILEMEVWETMYFWKTMYFKDEYNPFLIKRIKKTLPKSDLYNDYETLDYDIWINYPKKIIDLNSCDFWWKTERIIQKAFYKYVLYNEYSYRVIMLEKLTKPTKEDLLKMREYREKMNLYIYDWSHVVMWSEKHLIDVNKRINCDFTYSCY